MTRVPLGGDDDESALDEVVRTWAREWCESSTFSTIEHRREPDDRGHFHWLIRLRGEEKDAITLWLSLR